LNPHPFYDTAAEIVQLPPPERHAQLAALHSRSLAAYQAVLRRLTEADSRQRLSSGDDARTVAQIVGHIAEWDRFSMLGALDILVGVDPPRTINDLSGYIEPDGRRIDFDSVDAFNAYQAEKHSRWAWADLQALALDTASTLHALFVHPALLHASRLEATRRAPLHLENGVTIPDVAVGWKLWILVIEHMMVDHVQELGIDL